MYFFFTGTYRLLLTRKGRSAFRNANHCQGQLQTPQSVTLSMLPWIIQLVDNNGLERMRKEAVLA